MVNVDTEVNYLAHKYTDDKGNLNSVFLSYIFYVSLPCFFSLCVHLAFLHFIMFSLKMIMLLVPYHWLLLIVSCAPGQKHSFSWCVLFFSWGKGEESQEPGRMASEEAVYNSPTHQLLRACRPVTAGSYYSNRSMRQGSQAPIAKWICCSGAV